MIACFAFALVASSADAQLLKGALQCSCAKNQQIVSSTTTTLLLDNGSSATVTSPGLSNTAELKLQSRNLNAPPDNIVPDHAYEPAGTAGVGFFGNGTGGSTMGSTPEGGGTGYKLSSERTLLSGRNRRDTRVTVR